MIRAEDYDVLIACECSGAVRDAMIAAGLRAISCDVKPTRVPGRVRAFLVCRARYRSEAGSLADGTERRPRREAQQDLTAARSRSRAVLGADHQPVGFSAGSIIRKGKIP